MEFEGSRKVLNGKAIHLQQKGKGKRPNKADLITAEEEALLWESVLGQENPTSLFSSFLTNILAPGEDKSTTNCELKIWNSPETQLLGSFSKLSGLKDQQKPDKVV